MSEKITIRLAGEGIRPGSIRSREIAEILESIEDMVISESLKRNPKLKREDIIVGLYQIEDSSIGLAFKTTMETIAVPAFLAASLAVHNHDFDQLTTQSIKTLEVISNFSKKHNCVAEFRTSTHDDVLAEITPSTEIPKPTIIEGLTEITGKIVRVGGKKPRAMLELVDGTSLFCDVAQSLALELGHRLYRTAVFSGLAKWNIRDYWIEEFKIDSFEEIDDLSPSLAINQLSELIGNNFSDIEDVDAYVSSLRGHGGLS